MKLTRQQLADILNNGHFDSFETSTGDSRDGGPIYILDGQRVELIDENTYELQTNTKI